MQGIEPGSKSPVTPFNLIQFRGTGRLQGIGRNPVHLTNVGFFGHVEDRNEPGNERGANAGIDVDHYFLHVFTDTGDPHSSTVLLVEDPNGMVIPQRWSRCRSQEETFSFTSRVARRK